MSDAQATTTSRAPISIAQHEQPAESSQTARQLQEVLVSILEQQGEQVGAVAGIVYLVGTEARPAQVAATYTSDRRSGRGNGTPAQQITSDPFSFDESILARLRRAAETAAADEHGRGVVEPLSLTSRTGFYEAEPSYRALATPLIVADQVHGACVLVVPAASGIDTAKALDWMRTVSVRFEAFLWRQHSLAEAHAKTRLRQTLELLDASQQAPDADSMGAILCHELQTRFGCTRVSIGLIRGSRIRLAAVSGADELDRLGDAADALEAAMEEAADQDIELVYPRPPELGQDPAHQHVTRAHADLSRKFGPSAILSLPLRVEGDLVGVAVLERSPDDPFPAAAVPLLRLVAECIGPALWTRRMADRGVLAVVRDRVTEIAETAVGPRRTGVKALVLLLVLILAGLALVPIPGRVTAQAETRPVVWRTIPAPFPGYLAQVNVRPGDPVSEGDVLAVMDLRDAQLELARARSQLARFATQRDEAMSANETADAEIAAAAIAEVTATIALLEDRIERGTIRSPIDGKVSRGDAEQTVGAHVDPTQTLFEIVAEDRVRAVVEVGERSVSRVRPGQEGNITLAALPSSRLPVRVTSVRPAAEAVRGSNVYLAEAEFIEHPEWLKPGLTGSARLEDGWTTGLAWLLRPIIDEVRLRLWW